MVLQQRDLRQMLETAQVAARLAGQNALEQINYIKATIKNDAELVTAADKRCQNIIITRIKETYPDHGFIGEEGTNGLIYKQPPRGSEDIWWVIDPIDGTNNFAHQMLSFAVSIAVMQNGSPIAAAVFEPATESMFTAVKDGDAQFNTKKIAVSNSKLGQFESIALESMYPAGTPDYVAELFTKMRCRCLGSTVLHLSYVAKGAFVGLISPLPKLWDIAGGAFIVERAGGEVSDFAGSKIFPVDLQNYTGGSFDIIASNKTVHKDLLELVK